GLVKYNPFEFQENNNESKLNISYIRLFYKDTALLNGANLAYNENNISFHYTAICLTNPEKVRYRHKLEGFDQSWSPESKENYTTYSNLPPGRYNFLIRSCNNEGVWNLDSVSFSFTVSQPYWQRWWFILSMFLSVACIVVLIFQIRLNQIRRAQKKETAQEIEISKNELKALRSQMNPHFMFNSLNSIQHFILTHKEDEAVFYLNKFARLMRMILNNSEKSSITIREEVDALTLYLELEQMRFQNKFTYDIKIDEKIDIDYEHVPAMLIQPYCENAILHGLTPKKEPGTLFVEMKLQDRYLICSITDNGIGREKSAELKSHRSKDHKSMGMKITQDRLRLLNNVDQSDLSLQVIDLKDDKGLSLGTKVDIFIPVS
ncbi:MAG TPA: histidine kinase, partial [Nitrosopumilaceae archaeon]|nr:histidine kinase [Nitrosopumilaceae archaeon]